MFKKIGSWFLEKIDQVTIDSLIRKTSFLVAAIFIFSLFYYTNAEKILFDLFCYYAFLLLLSAVILYEVK